MAKLTAGSIAASAAGILLSGVAGGMAGWAAMRGFGLDGVWGALLAAVVGMVVATATWVGLTVLLRAVGLLR